jgi:hypothetical protein
LNTVHAKGYDPATYRETAAEAMPPGAAAAMLIAADIQIRRSYAGYFRKEEACPNEYCCICVLLLDKKRDSI